MPALFWFFRVHLDWIYRWKHFVLLDPQFLSKQIYLKTLNFLSFLNQIQMHPAFNPVFLVSLAMQILFGWWSSVFWVWFSPSCLCLVFLSNAWPCFIEFQFKIDISLSDWWFGYHSIADFSVWTPSSTTCKSLVFSLNFFLLLWNYFSFKMFNYFWFFFWIVDFWIFKIFGSV